MDSNTICIHEIMGFFLRPGTVCTWELPRLALLTLMGWFLLSTCVYFFFPEALKQGELVQEWVLIREKVVVCSVEEQRPPSVR